MSLHYRPFTLARQGELSALRSLSSSTHDAITPVFLIPPRQWDYDAGGFNKGMADHLAPLASKLHDARGSRLSFVDVSLLDSRAPVGGKHPLVRVVEETEGLGLPAIPMSSPGLDGADYAAVAGLHAAYGRGVAVRLTQEEWTTIDSTQLASVLSSTGLTMADADIFIDYDDAHGVVIQAAVEREVQALAAAGARSITAGGSAFPSVSGSDRGVTEIPRTDWTTFEGLHGRLKRAGSTLPDYFDYLVLDIESLNLAIDPRFMSISAAFRYATSEHWLFAKGALFKGQGGSGQGGAALPPALLTLQSHPLYGTPVVSQADSWISDVISGAATPGNPTKWREWATVRHIEVTENQLASLT